MLTSLRIQNFRSIRDASVKLGQVNLFIGPNNSGKSNFLKGIEFAAARIFQYPDKKVVTHDWYKYSLPRQAKISLGLLTQESILFEFEKKIEDAKFCKVQYRVEEDYRLPEDTISDYVSSLVIDRSGVIETREDLDLPTNSSRILAFPQEFYSVRSQLENTVVYSVEPASFEISVRLSNQPLLNKTGSNIANFLNTLSQNHEGLFGKLKSDFTSCIGNLVSVSTPPDPRFEGNLTLKFFDSQGNSYWAEEVSEGVLYFLALLCIVHQPDPPKLLLLEEPEKGIHPRRIREVMDFIFELARLRDIQIILTSHSPYVVDRFADIPECISVFDRENGETVIRNAQDIIDGINAEYKKQGLPPTNYTDSLGEHWVSGFLGGVPL